MVGPKGYSLHISFGFRSGGERVPTPTNDEALS